MDIASRKTADVVIAGGGISGILFALEFKAFRPHKSVLLITKTTPGNQFGCWPFFETESENRHAWIKQAASVTWDEMWVHFPEFSRKIQGRLYLFERQALGRLVASRLQNDYITGTGVSHASVDNIQFPDGRRLEAPLIFDARNLEADQVLGPHYVFRQTVGLRFASNEAHGVDVPIILDARCPQDLGFQYFSVYPLDRSSLYVEVTHYSSDPRVNTLVLKNQILKYIGYKGWDVRHVMGAHWSVIPIPLRASPSRIMQLSAMDPAPLGVESGLYHYGTGYSLPRIADLAHQIAVSGRWSSGLAKAILKKAEDAHIKTQNFNIMVNDLVFRKTKLGSQYEFARDLFQSDENFIKKYLSSSLQRFEKIGLISKQRQFPVRQILSLPFQ